MVAAATDIAAFGGGWAQDFPRADHDCLVALRRLTRIDSPSPLNVVDIDDDHMWDYPWIYAVGVSNWAFTDAEAQRLRNFIARGGFLMVDHFHGQDDWNRFMSGMSMVLPDAVVEDIPDDDAIFHDLYDINEKFQIPGEQYVATGRTYEKDGYIPGWRCIRDKDGRIVVAICFQHAPRRRLGVGRCRRLSREVLRPRLSRRAQLHHLRHDALKLGRSADAASGRLHARACGCTIEPWFANARPSRSVWRLSWRSVSRWCMRTR